MSDAELLLRPVDELARLVRDGELRATELVETSLRAIERVDDQLDAFIDVDAERALAAAAQIHAGDQRPFAGVPIAIKNNRPVAGWRYTNACDLMGDHVPDFDAHVVTRLRNAGFVIVGTTNLPEYGIQPVTEPRRFPPSRTNPRWGLFPSRPIRASWPSPPRPTPFSSAPSTRWSRAAR